MKATTAPSADVAALRDREFPWTAETIYLNNASIGPLPARTVRALEEFTQRRQRPYLLNDAALQGLLSDGRTAAARLIHADSAEIGLATNTSYGLNVAAGALPLERDDVVVISQGEFPANVYPWLLLQRRGVRVELLPATARGWPNEDRMLERIADPRVRVAAVSLVQFSNGYRYDLGRLSDACRAHDTFLVVDGIQGLGAVPFDVRDTPVDILSSGAQKWLLGPWGAGFFYVRRELIEQLQPAFSGWMAFAGTDDFSRLTAYDATFHDDARRFEMVTLPFQDIRAMIESLGLIAELGPERILAHVRAVRRPLLDARDRGALEIVSPTDPAHDSAIVCLRTADTRRAYDALQAAGVACSFREGSIRLSPHAYNTEDEIARVTEMLVAG